LVNADNSTVSEESNKVLKCWNHSVLNLKSAKISISDLLLLSPLVMI